jgi:arylsulfatase A-like enzyme
MKTGIIVAIIVLVLGIIGGVFIYHNLYVEKSHNILLLSVDTVRYDRLGYAGHSRPVSPNIDRLAEEGVIFPNAISQSGWTIPSMATILTGEYPKDHGATALQWRIDKRLPTLADILKKHGYDTHGYVSHVFLKPEYGFSKGFVKFDYSVLRYGNPHKVATSKRLSDLALKSLREIREPFFLWMHYFDPHFLYLSHKKWAYFGDSVIDRYDQEIAFTDYHIGRLLDYLRKSRLYSRTIVIFTSDHGEEFGEHGGQDHDTSYQEVIRVPLIIRAPFLKPKVSPLVAEQIDLLPTILAMLNIEPTEDYPGKNLFGSIEANRPVFVERDWPPEFEQRTVIHDDHKLIRIRKTNTRRTPPSSPTFGGNTNLRPGTVMFDLSLDPSEEEDIFSEGNPKAKEILAMLTAHFARASTPVEKVEVDEEMRQKLRSLGYIR